MAVDGDQGYKHVAGDHEGGEAGKEAKKDEDASNEFGEGGDVAEPMGEAKRGDEVAVVIESGERVAAVEAAGRDDFAVAVVDHRAAEDEAQKEGPPGLEAVERFGHRKRFLKVRVTRERED